MVETIITPCRTVLMGECRRRRPPAADGLLTCTTSILSTLDIDDRDGPSNSFGFS